MQRHPLVNGSALSIVLILAVAVGSVVTTFLGRTLVEQKRVAQRGAQIRAARQAVGQLELAKAIISASAYDDGQNVVVQQAIAASPPVIPGTGVLIESVGANRWYRLVSFGEYSRDSGAALTYLRDGTPYVAYNYYVEDQSLGISGKPRGRIHTNQSIEFYYANGYYDDFVSCVDGFVYKNGATSQNTTFAGGTDPAAEVKDLLDLIDYDDLKAEAAVITPTGLEAAVTLVKKNVKIELWSKPQIVKVAVVKTKKVQVGTVYQKVTKTQYRKEYQWVDVTKSRKVWVPSDNSQSTGGTDVGAVSDAGGYWKTESYVVKEYKLVNVPNGTYTTYEWVPVYENQKVTTYVDQLIPGTLQSTTTYPADGRIFYFRDNVKSLGGELNGRATLVADYGVLINDSLQYIDSAGEYAMQHGEDSSKSYDPNPKFQRNHALGIIAKGDIRYSKSCPNHLEINASLISTSGTVGFEGIVVADDGALSLDGSSVKREGLRRYGSVMCSKRPVATLLDAGGQLLHGFKTGESLYDRNLITNPPAGYPNEEVVMWAPNMMAEGGDFTPAGSGTYDSALVTPIGKLTPLSDVHELVRTIGFAWTKDVCTCDVDAVEVYRGN